MLAGPPRPIRRAGDVSATGADVSGTRALRTATRAGGTACVRVAFRQPGATRLLGWERPPHRANGAGEPCPRPCDSAYGSELSDAAFGHTGWTGTLLWADPARDLFVVFLTNRSYAPRLGNSIRALRGVRGALADALVRSATP